MVDKSIETECRLRVARAWEKLGVTVNGYRIWGWGWGGEVMKMF